ncbi:MAG: hypothetical protein ABR595_00195 [Psychroflexus sp.]
MKRILNRLYCSFVIKSKLYFRFNKINPALRHSIALMVILFLLNSCKYEESKKEKNKEIETITKSTSKSEIAIEEPVKVEEQYIINDSLLVLFSSNLNEIALNPKFNLKAEPTKNKHTEKVIDTIKTLTYDKTEIISYQSTEWESIYKAKIQNPEFEFYDDIKTGISKDNFQKKIGIELESNLIKIGVLEQTSYFIFRFKDDVLKEIGYNGYVD